MKNWVSKIFAILLITSFYSFNISVNIPAGISSAFKSGNSQSLAQYFNENIELVILNKENVYSKRQAELIVKDFFNKYPPQTFKILHEGGKNGSQYAIGKLSSGSKSFRVYFLIKKQNNRSLIHQLRIEDE